MKTAARLCLLLLASTAVCRADGATDAYRALGIKPQKILVSTVLNSPVLPGGDKQVVCIATYLTGKKSRSEAVNVKFGVFKRSGDRLVPVYERDFGAERGGK